MPVLRVSLPKISFELLGKRSSNLLRTARGWLLAGLAGPLVISVAALMYPFQMAFHLTFLKTMLFITAGWYYLFASCWVIGNWFSRTKHNLDTEMGHTPLPRVQFLVHRMLDIVLIPAVTTLLTIPLFGIVLYYIGQPLTDWHEADRGLDPGDWTLRSILLLVVLVNTTLLATTLGILVQESCRTAWARVASYLVVTGAIWFLSMDWLGYYLGVYGHNTPGIPPQVFLGPILSVLLLPFFVAYLTDSKRRIMLAVIGGLVVIAVAYMLLLPAWSPASIQAFTFRYIPNHYFAAEYCVSSLNPIENLTVISEHYRQSIVIDDHIVGNLIPQRLASWVGACLIAPLASVVCIIGLLAGCALKPQTGSDRERAVAS